MKRILSVITLLIMLMASVSSFGAGSVNYIESYNKETGILIVTWYCDDLTGGTVSDVGSYTVKQSGYIRWCELVPSQTNTPGASWTLTLRRLRGTLYSDAICGLGTDPATDAVTNAMVVDNVNGGIVEVRYGDVLTPYSTSVDTGAFSLSITIKLDGEIDE